MKITGSFAAYRYLKALMIADVEEFWSLALRPDKSVIASKCLFRGTVDACLVHPRDIFRFGCLNNASSLIIAHNHPTQDARPSKADIEITRQLVKVSKLLQIPIDDHLVVTSQGYFSFADTLWSKRKTISSRCATAESAKAWGHSPDESP